MLISVEQIYSEKFVNNSYEILWKWREELLAGTGEDILLRKYNRKQLDDK
jgi:hypothetical protein